jgi:hypothetical protein
VHRVVLENDFIRIFDARASRGAKSPLHTHPPMVLVSLAGCQSHAVRESPGPGI